MNQSLMKDINGLLYSHFSFLLKMKWKSYFDGDFSKSLYVFIYITYILLHYVLYNTHTDI